MKIDDEDIANIVDCIERELDTGDISFPIYLGQTFKIKKLLDRGETDVAKLGRAISLDPLLSVKLVNLARTSAFNPAKRKVPSPCAAIRVLGLDIVSFIIQLVIDSQIKNEVRGPSNKHIASNIWRYYVDSSCWAYALSDETGNNPEVTFYLSMASSLLEFYLLSRVDFFSKSDFNSGLAVDILSKYRRELSVQLYSVLGVTSEEIEILLSLEDSKITHPVQSIDSLIKTARFASEYTNVLDPSITDLKAYCIENKVSEAERTELFSLRDSVKSMQEKMFEEIVS